MNKEVIDEVVQRYLFEMLAFGTPRLLANTQADILRASMYRTYGIEKEAADAHN